MMLKRSTHETKSKKGFSSRLVKAGLASVLAAASAAGLATGCLDRKVVVATPTTSNVFVDQIVQTAVDKIDLLFMVDNSVSMADKQEILAAAVPVLLGRLVAPICVDANGNSTNTNVDANGQCSVPNSSAEFPPINDIHIGIVSSSLGAHGGSVCSAPSPNDPPGIIEYLDDKGELTGATRPGVTTWNNSGFLAWDPTGTKDTPPGENNAANLNTAFTTMLTAVGEHGCGYEASLEAWYRFLIDPNPPASVAKDPMTGFTTRTGTDSTLLTQRAAFLRPDSLVAVIMLSDENDCSIQDSGVGWFVGATSHMPKASSACAANPNDACCRSCAQVEASPPAGCMPLTQDSVCMGAAAGSYNTWDTLNDSLNLRCYNQKQRFGFDLLYNTNRYVNGLTQPQVIRDSDGMAVTNPLYDPGSSGKAPRDPSLVFLAGLVGVPWQDISTPESLTGTGLTYLAANDILTQGRWTQLLGNPNTGTTTAPTPPTDPFMVESIDPRSGTNPNIADSIAPATSTSPTTSKINGHEQNIPQRDDLQFACTFPLATSRACAAGDSACDCSATAAGDASAVVTANSPLCQPPGGGPAGTTQYFAKAYPGARELTVLRDFKDNAIVASICPKNTSPASGLTKQSDPNYGYNPAVGAIIDRLKEALKGKCLPRKINTDPTTHLVECEVIEATKNTGTCGDCSQPGRSPAPSTINPAVFSQLEASGSCGTAAGQTPCDTTGFCLCQINQEENDDLTQCQSGGTPPDAGYCYIDGDDFPDAPALKNCPANQKRVLRFVDAPDGTKTPAQGAIAFIACLGANINGDGGT